MTAICIAGMHRSGTSMVAHLLYRCGVYLGPEDELVPPALGNADGHWENLRFLEVNSDVLTQLAGGWDLAPHPPPDWERGPGLMPLRNAATALVRDFDGHSLWGWKDPRSSLTLPMWLDLIPGLKVLVCLRSPLEVADSLSKRRGTTRAFGVNLWLEYNRAILAATRAETRVVTHYEAYFHDPEAELKRVCQLLDLAIPDETIAHACSSVSEQLRHNRAPVEAQSAPGVPAAVAEVYRALCREAGPIREAATQADPSVETPRQAVGAPTSPPAEIFSDAGSASELGAEATSKLNEVWAHAAAVSAQFYEMRQYCGTLLGTVFQLRRQNAALEKEVAALKGQLAERANRCGTSEGLSRERHSDLH